MSHRPPSRRSSGTSPHGLPPLRRYKVILHRAADKGLKFVARAVMDLTHFGEAEAEYRMWDAYYNGRTLIVVTHLEPLAAPSKLWVLRNPRRRQAAALLALLQAPRFRQGTAGTVLGGDFNTVQGGPLEDAYRFARAWSESLRDEDGRATHVLGRLDYLFARLLPDWSARTIRAEQKYGSDHFPVVMGFRHRTLGN